MLEPAALSVLADDLETEAAITTVTAPTLGGYWKRIALAAEELAGGATSGSTTLAGWMSRTAAALETTAVVANSANADYYGYLGRMAMAEEVLAIGLNFGTVTPLNQTLPSISGTAQQGETLTASTGTWFWATSYTYQWLADGVAIGTATASTYILTGTEVGKVITVAVTGHNAGADGVAAISAATDAVTAVVAALVDLNFVTATYTINGSAAAVGDALWGDPDWWGAWNATDIIADVGLRVMVTDGGFTASSGPGFTETVKALMRGGCRLLFDFTATVDGNAMARLYAGIADDSSYTFGCESYSLLSSGTYPEPSATYAFNYNSGTVTGPTPTAGDHTVEFWYLDNETGLKYDSSALASFANSDPNGMGVSGFHIKADTLGGGTYSATVIVKRLRIYAEGRP